MIVDDDKLLPCKFCGGKARIEYGFNYDYDGGDRWYVYSADVVCDCGCTLHVDNARPKEYVSEEHMVDFAIDAWNRSSTMTDTEKAALERRIDELCAEVERGKAEFKKMDVWHSQELEAAIDENAKLRKMNEAMWLIIRCAIGEVSARDGLPVIHEDDLTMLRNMRRDLRNEVDE